jgi:undecaprenyl diphosphate synthase
MEPNNLPNHIAIIMDGNGRWARERGLPRIRGHREGVNSVREITRECAKLGIRQLTLYAFSAENWKRPKSEVNFLMRMLRRFLIAERKEIMENDIRLTAIGRIHELPKAVQAELGKTREMSADNKGMTLCLALNYGGRTEIVDAVAAIAKEVSEGKRQPKDVSEDTISAHLYTAGMPDPDLLIRTSGEMRVSNFLLWQISYTELYVTPLCWPDFRKPQLMEAIADYQKRERRFGAITPITKGVRPL